MSAPDVGAVFAALADPTRRQLLDALGEAGEASASALAAPLPVSRQAVLKHLQVLEDAGLVDRARAGRVVFFRISPDPLARSARWLDARAALWDRRLLALKREAEEGGSASKEPGSPSPRPTVAPRPQEPLP